MKHAIIHTKNYLMVVDNSENAMAHLPLNGSPIVQSVDLLPPLEQEDGVEKLAMDILKNKWSHLYKFGLPKKPYPKNYENDLNNVMVGIYKAKENERNKLTPFKNLITLIENGLLKGTFYAHNLLIDELKVCSEYLQSQKQLKMPIAFEF